MKTKFILLSVFSCMSLLTHGQEIDSITLLECYSLAKLNFPSYKLYELTDQTHDLETEILDANFLPGISAYGKASYQSDALTMVSSFPGAPGVEVDKFQYNVGINVEQKIFDGGINRIQKNIKNLETEIKNSETQASLNQLYTLVNEYFFGIQSMIKNIHILNLKTDVLNKKLSNIESAVNNNMLPVSELYRIETEIISAQQQTSQFKSSVLNLETGLKILIGKNNAEIEWILPDSIYIPDSVNRPEYKLFEHNRQIFNQMQNLQSKTFLPQLSAYGQTGYSYPGLNMFENQPDGFYILGGKLGWKIFDWNQAGKNKQVLEIKKEETDIKEQEFTRSLSIQIQNMENEIILINELLKKDDEIIQKKQQITKSSESALENGTITAFEYISDFNAELKARLDFELHKINLLEAESKLTILKGTINE